MPLGCSWFSSPPCHAASAPWQASCLLWLSSCQRCNMAGHQFPKLTAEAVAWPATITLLSRNTPCACPVPAAASPRRSIHPNTKSPHRSYLPNTCWRQRRGHCDCVLPGTTRRTTSLGQVPTTTFERLQTPQPGLELTLSSNFYHTCAVGWMMLVLGYFGQLNHYLFSARLL